MIAGRHPGVMHPLKGAGGPPLVLLHGFLGAPSSWDDVLDALPSHGPAWCPWLPGHGPAAPQPSHWHECVDALATTLPEGALIAGYSLGARLALAATLQRGDAVRAALLVGGHVGPADATERAQRAALDAQRAAALRAGPLGAFVTDWEALPLFASQRRLSASTQARQRAVRLAHDPHALAWAFEVAGLARMPDLRTPVARARVPLWFLTGALDTRFGALAASQVRPPWVAHHVVPGAGHNLLLEAATSVASVLLGLIEASTRSCTGGVQAAPSGASA
jgi:2-succinyl-6-hydroxy-2,4-cyclohexadiene-1-carboxylate synthase